MITYYEVKISAENHLSLGSVTARLYNCRYE